MLNSNIEDTHTQYELHKSTKNFHMMTWQKRVNFDTDVETTGMDDSFHLQAGSYLDTRESTTDTSGLQGVTRRISKVGIKLQNSLRRMKGAQKVAPAKETRQETSKSDVTTLFPELNATKSDSPTIYLMATNNALGTCYITKKNTGGEKCTLNVVKPDDETIKDRYNLFLCINLLINNYNNF